MTKLKIEEGYMPFMGHQVYYRIVGERQEGKAPLLLIHGGPGSTHNYFEVLDGIAATGHQVISYDQIGCGNSWVEGHPELFTREVWTKELIALREHLHLDHVHLLGQSWGGMLILSYLIEEKPAGVVSAIISSGGSSSALWAKEQHRLIKYMSAEDQEAIRKAEETGDFDTPEYHLADDHYTEAHACDLTGDSRPECVRRKKRFGTEAYLTAWGPNEYTPLGNLKDFDCTPRLSEITTPTLIISGTDDECTPFLAKTMNDGIPGSKWVLLWGARHMTFVDCHEEYCRLLAEWLENHSL